LPLSHNSGIIEFIDDAVTIDDLIKKQGNLNFIRKNKIKRNNFIKSLVGYSLVSYFLQVKDRHNQNIMVKRDGTLVHIDYGFFMSSAPGKGV
jgi:phosphatidylinositol 4-kinase B